MVVNLATQGYYPRDLGCSKVMATGEMCRLLSPQLKLATYGARFTRSTPKAIAGFYGEAGTAVFCCVDSISTRKLVWESVLARAALFVDARMNGEVIRVLTSDEPPVDRRYLTTFFEPHEAHSGSCTAKGTIYTASVAAGLMISQFTKWLRNLPVDKDLSLNLLSSELSAA